MVEFVIKYKNMNTICYNFTVDIYYDDEYIDTANYSVQDDDIFLTVCYLVSIINNECNELVKNANKKYTVYLPKNWINNVSEEMQDSYDIILDTIDKLKEL